MTTSAFCAHGARFSLWLALLACTKPLAVTNAPTPPAATVAVVPGVSRELAEDRARRISRLGYQLALTVPPRKADPVTATETLTFHLADTRQPVQLDFKEQADRLKSLTINGKSAAIDFREEHLVLPAASLKTGSNQVEIHFIAGNQSLNRNDDYLYTLLVPDRARTVFPVFDQPSLKASFTLALTVPKTWQALANGPLQDSTVTAENKTLRFAPSDTISTYLFSFAAGRFTRISRSMAGRDMQFLHRETDKNKLKLSLNPIFQIHADALKFLEEYTGIPYPFRKFDFVALPDFQYGGMEHVGAIDYKASTLFLDEGATQDQKIARSNLISHETAHMWFGDLVTMQWFNDVWMKEVFANFMADKITEIAVANSNYDLKFVVDHYPAAYGVDRTAGANPIRQELDNLKDAGSLYGNIIYHKAPIMMRQLERLMGEEPFRQGLQEYLRKYAYGNATWPDLIVILDARTPADLQTWNQVWVNQPGRPVFSYRRGGHDGQTVLEITQQAEDGSARLWPQEFTVLLEFEDGRTQERTVKMTEREATLKVSGNPQRVVFNATGIGYGVFPVDAPSAAELVALRSSVTRAAAYVNLYENMLNGRTLAPRQLLDVYRQVLPKEPEELNIKLLTGQATDIFWKLLKPAERVALAPALEKELWTAMQQNSASNSKKLLFKAYQSVALTKEAQTRLYTIWNQQQAPPGIKLTEDDYTALALALAVRDYPAAQPILPAQLARIQNPDRQKRLQFLLPALAPDVATRDAFFASLKDEKNREKEAWVVSALGYLHHPLRAATSEKYLPESLALLEEIQQTGDIFFPYSWLQATLGFYQTPTAARTVREFLAAHPQYNPKLRAKLLQAADDLFRAEKLVR
ncbi:aminopeptidase [Hymenobacter sp. BT186]|uniref:Aminopeptidase N n=1 Tax=Hymenobacter telluris TaxID=2816474 RepID=A0A939EX77_9BACT|nr:M1 family aminopeptidase [Hymenobacter telluris]MBO0358701.1 aminopeptidase [Hymenobacter telluris]MBW3374727.1 aminopeptidase [Hymenobacter norwichensis]